MEFVEVMKHFKRMCDAAKTGCSGCALQGMDCCIKAIANNLDLCEGCGEWKQVVLKVKEKEYE